MTDEGEMGGGERREARASGALLFEQPKNKRYET